MKAIHYGALIIVTVIVTYAGSILVADYNYKKSRTITPCCTVPSAPVKQPINVAVINRIDIPDNIGQCKVFVPTVTVKRVPRKATTAPKKGGTNGYAVTQPTTIINNNTEINNVTNVTQIQQNVEVNNVIINKRRIIRQGGSNFISGGTIAVPIVVTEPQDPGGDVVGGENRPLIDKPTVIRRPPPGKPEVATPAPLVGVGCVIIACIAGAKARKRGSAE